MQSRACPSCLRGVQRWLSKEAAAGNAPKGLSGIGCPAWGHVGTSSEVLKVWRPQLQPGWAPVALRDVVCGSSAWAVNAEQSVCVGKKSAKEKLQENSACSPDCQVQQRLNRRTQQLPHGLCSLSHSAQAQGTHSKPVPQQAPGPAPLCHCQGEPEGAQREGIPRADSEVASDRLL